MEKVGVEAVVEGFGEFINNLAQMAGAADKFSASLGLVGTGAGKTNSFVGNLISGVSNLALVVGGAATGNVALLSQGITGLIGTLTQLIGVVVNVAVSIGKTLLSAIVSVIKLALAPFVAAWKAIVDVVKVAIGVFAGISLANLFQGMVDGVKGLVDAAFTAAKAFQVLEIRLQGLLAIQIAAGTTTSNLIKVTNELSAAQQLRGIELNRVLNSQRNELDQLAQAYKRTYTEMGTNSVAALQLQARMDELQGKIAGTSGELEYLQSLKTATVLQEITRGTMSFADALQAAVPRAKALFDWLSRIGILTPFTVQEVANVFTLATSYGFAEQEAKQLTQAVIDFTSGMGLSGTEMERIIQNLGQMVQQGKITGTELRDLARGSFVPVNEVLARTAEIMGITVEQLNKLRAAGKAPPEPFIQAFIEFATESFPDAARRMSRTFPGVISNIKDLVETVLGMRVIKPALDSVSGVMADFLETLLTARIGTVNGVTTMFDAMGDNTLSGIADRIGASIKKIVDGFVNGLPGVESAVQSVLIWLDRLADSVELFANTGDLEAALLNLGIPQGVLDAANGFLSTMRSIKNFIFEQGPQIADALLGAFGGIWETLFPGGKNPFTDLQGGLSSFLDNWNQGGFQKVLDDIQVGFQNFLDFILGKQAGGAETNIFDRLLENLQPAIDGLKSIGKAISENLLPAIQSLVGAFTGGGAGGAKGGSKNGTGLLGAFAELAKFGFSAIALGINGIASAIEFLAGWIDRTRGSLEFLAGILGEMSGFAGGGTLGNPIPVQLPWDTTGMLPQAPAEPTELFAGGWDSFFAGIKTAIENEAGPTAATTATFVDGVTAEFQRMYDEVVGHSIVPDMMADINSEFTASLGVLVGSTGTMLSMLVMAFSLAATNIKTKFSSAGAAAMNGFVTGFITTWAKRKPELQVAIEEIVDFIEDILKIGSPSKVFADIGMQMASGMALGVQRGVPLVRAAMESVMSSIPGSASMPFTGGSSSTNIVNYNVQMQATNNFPTTGGQEEDLSAVLALLRGF